jgi:hypothetical protein
MALCVYSSKVRNNKIFREQFLKSKCLKLIIFNVFSNFSRNCSKFVIFSNSFSFWFKQFLISKYKGPIYLHVCIIFVRISQTTYTQLLFFQCVYNTYNWQQRLAAICLFVSTNCFTCPIIHFLFVNNYKLLWTAVHKLLLLKKHETSIVKICFFVLLIEIIGTKI